MPKFSRRLVEATLSAATLAIPVFLLAPSFIYSNNPHDISLEFGNILLFSLVFSIAAVIILTPICLFTRGSFIVAGLGFAVAVKLLFLPSFVPLLDGEEVFAKISSADGLWSVATLVVLVIAGSAIARRLNNGTLAFIAATFILFGLQPLLSAENWSFDWPSLGREGSLEPGSPEAKVFEFSREGDTVIVLLDTIQSDVFAEVLEDHPGYREALTGFTYFWNTVGESPTTLMSMLPIYSGRPYGGGSISARYDGLRQDSVFADFEKQGYESMLLGISIMGCPAASCGNVKKLINVPEIESDLSEYLELVELGLMRAFPTFVHESWYNRGSGRLRAFLPHIPVNHAHQSIAAIESIASGFEVSDGPQNLKVLHLLGAHPPITLNERCRAVSVKGKRRHTYKDLVECNVRTFIKFVEALKAGGIYNELALVLMADHGETTKAPPQPLEPFLGVVPALSERRGRFGPLLAIKLPNADHPFQLSGVPAQISDLRATLCGEVIQCEQGVPGDNVFRLDEGAPRERCFLDFLLWQTDHRRLDGMPPEAYRKFCMRGLLRDADYDPSTLPPRTDSK